MTKKYFITPDEIVSQFQFYFLVYSSLDANCTLLYRSSSFRKPYFGFHCVVHNFALNVKVKSGTCYSASYMRWTQDQKRFYNLESGS